MFYSEAECPTFKPHWEDEREEHEDSSACSDASLTDLTLDDDSNWHCPPRAVWKPTVEVRTISNIKFRRRQKYESLVSSRKEGFNKIMN